MARFTTRVELHSASESDYQTLHKEMEKEGFVRTISDSNGVKYQLPTAEYNKDGNFSLEQVFISAEKASKVTGKSYDILVTESAGRRWSLKKA